MILRSKNVFSCLYFRPRLGIPLGLWIAVSVVYYWWLISRISLLETQNKVFKSQLKLTQEYDVPPVSITEKLFSLNA